MYTPFPSMFSCQGEKGNIGMLVWGEGGKGGRRGREGEGEGFWCSPTDSPNPLEEAKLHRRTWGSFMA